MLSVDMEYGLSVVEGSSVTYPACVSVFYVFDRVFESCLKMLPGDMD